MEHSWIQQLLVAYRRRNKILSARRRRRGTTALSTKHGMLLIVAIGTFVALAVLLALHVMSSN